MAEILTQKEIDALLEVIEGESIIKDEIDEIKEIFKNYNIDSFKKAYVIDTNIILQNHQAPFLFSDNGENLIIITETVLQELDKFKVGTDDINYQAREFNRALSDAEIVSKFRNSVLIKKTKNNLETYILLLNNLDQGLAENNDDKIINTIIIAKDRIKNIFGINEENIIFISNDILFRTKAILKGMEAQPFFKEQFDNNIEFTKEYYIDELMLNKEFFQETELEKLGIKNIPNHITFLKIIENETGKLYVLMRELNGFKKIDLKSSINYFGVKPRNLEQRLLMELLTGDIDIAVVDSVAGTGKTLLALVSALELFKKGKCDSITYIRKTIISGDKQDELGFLPGNLQEKLIGYLFPLKDNIEMIIKLKNKKKKRWTQEEIDEAIKAFENEFNIKYEYLGHLRGRNLSGLIILDEAQNYTINDIVTILSRITEGSRVFILGSTKQIDNPYLNKYNNALTFLLNQCGKDENVKVRGMKLEKVERGKIVDWIEKITQEL